MSNQNTLKEKIIKTIRKHQLIREGDHILAGVSGGPDSLCMLTILNGLSKRMKFRLTVAHFNHLIRGEDSNREEKFVRDHVSGLGLPFVSGRGSVAAYRKEYGGSREEAARILRYRFFEEEAKRLSANKVALAHHTDDQAETVLMKMIRGAGPRGLSGILPIRGGTFIRPLLFVTKKQITSFLEKNKIPYCKDQSNLEKDCFRNKVRLELVPHLVKQYNRNVVRALGQTAEILREEEDFLQKYTEGLFPSCVMEKSEDRVVFKRSVLKELPPAIQRRILRNGIEKVKSDLMRFSYTHIEDALELIENEVVGKSLDWPGGIRAIFSYDTVGIVCRGKKKELKDDHKRLPVPGSVLFMGKKITSKFITVKGWNGKKADGENTAWFDQKKVFPPFLIRSRKPGDRFQPLGMDSEKKIKDIFIDRKIPLEERDAIPLLISKGKIVWIGGVGISESVKITNNTVKVVKVTLKYL